MDPLELQEHLQERIHEGTVSNEVPQVTEVPKNVEVNLGGKCCKCGSTTHKRTSHHDCPLNKNK